MDKNFERAYSLPIGKLKKGQNEVKFLLDKAFLSHFEHAPIEDCEATASLAIHRYDTHLDVTFLLKGKMQLECDRCLEMFSYPFEAENRVLYAFEEDMTFSDEDEVQYVSPSSAEILIGSDLYDFLCLAIPYRKTHEDANENCSEEIMRLLGLNEKDETETEEEAAIDPRWEMLRKLKDKE
ncbi:MAG: YceD family protein [Ferruginibacter sp.]